MLWFWDTAPSIASDIYTTHWSSSSTDSSAPVAINLWVVLKWDKILTYDVYIAYSNYNKEGLSFQFTERYSNTSQATIIEFVFLSDFPPCSRILLQVF